MELVLYQNFSKRINSTKRPSGGVTDYVNLKNNTSINSPVFEIQNVDTSVNYCYCPNFGRYYFITDIVITNARIYELHCTTDVLATYKNSIGSYTGFVERASTGYDELVSDNQISTRYNYRTFLGAETQIFPVDSEGGSDQGSIIIRTNGKNGLTSYITTWSGLRGVMDYMYTSGNFEELFTDLMNQLTFNPQDYLVSLMWSPFSEGYFKGSTQNITMGWFDTGISGKALSIGTDTTRAFTVAPPTGTYTDFRRYDDNFSHYIMRLPAVGVVDIPADVFKDGNIRVIYSYDGFSGGGSVSLYTGGNELISRYPASLFCEIPVSSLISHYDTVAPTIIGGLTDFKFNPVETAVNAVRAVTSPVSSVTGNSNGNMSEMIYYPNARIFLRETESCEFPLAVAGRPVMKNRTLSSFNGYVKCGGASIPITGFGNDKTEVDNYVNGGFYYE